MIWHQQSRSKLIVGSAGVGLVLTLCLLLGIFQGLWASENERRELFLNLWQDVASAFEDVPVVDAQIWRAQHARAPEAWAILDVRTSEERQISMLQGAKPWSGKTDLDDVRLFKDRKVLVYCTLGYRSAKVVRALRKRGIDAHNLKGGLLGWAWSGGPPLVSPSGERVKKLHVFGPRWSLLPDDWQGLW